VLKVWNESGTNRGRIGDSAVVRVRSPRHMAQSALANTTSGVRGARVPSGFSPKALTASRSRFRGESRPGPLWIMWKAEANIRLASFRPVPVCAWPSVAVQSAAALLRRFAQADFPTNRTIHVLSLRCSPTSEVAGELRNHWLSLGFRACKGMGRLCNRDELRCL
jgi:hypothetical protein